MQMKSKRINYGNRWRKWFPYSIARGPSREKELQKKEHLTKVAAAEDALVEVMPAEHLPVKEALVEEVLGEKILAAHVEEILTEELTKEDLSAEIVSVMEPAEEEAASVIKAEAIKEETQAEDKTEAETETEAAQPEENDEASTTKPGMITSSELGTDFSIKPGITHPEESDAITLDKSERPASIHSVHPDIVAPALLNFEQIVRDVAEAQETETPGAPVESGKEEKAGPGNIIEEAKPRNIIEELYNEKFKAPGNPEA